MISLASVFLFISLHFLCKPISGRDTGDSAASGAPTAPAAPADSGASPASRAQADSGVSHAPGAAALRITDLDLRVKFA